jgi:hypothetical protein
MARPAGNLRIRELHVQIKLHAAASLLTWSWQGHLVTEPILPASFKMNLLVFKIHHRYAKIHLTA